MTSRRRPKGASLIDVDLPSSLKLDLSSEELLSPTDYKPVLIKEGPRTIQVLTSPTSISSDYSYGLQEDMPCRNRTVEFVSIVKSLQSNQSHPPQVASLANGYQHSPSEFSQRAKLLSKEVYNTYTKLEKLSLLAKKKTLFDDRSADIQDLIHIIRQDIQYLNQQISQLSELGAERSVSRTKHAQGHTQSVTTSLQRHLAGITENFKDVLMLRTESLKQQKQKRDQFGTGELYDPIASTLDVAETQPSSHRTSEFSLDMEPLLQAQQQNQLMLRDEERGYLQSRSDTMEVINSTMVELGTIFQRLSHLVSEQREQIMRIDANVETTELNVASAHQELLKYFQGITSNRWLYIKIFFVLIVALIVFVVFVA